MADTVELPNSNELNFNSMFDVQCWMFETLKSLNVKGGTVRRTVRLQGATGFTKQMSRQSLPDPENPRLMPFH